MPAVIALNIMKQLIIMGQTGKRAMTVETTNAEFWANPKDITEGSEIVG